MQPPPSGLSVPLLSPKRTYSPTYSPARTGEEGHRWLESKDNRHTDTAAQPVGSVCETQISPPRPSSQGSRRQTSRNRSIGRSVTCPQQECSLRSKVPHQIPTEPPSPP